jgi:multidrug resistance protein, MATE family
LAIQVGLLWWYAEPLLVLARQPVEVAAMAARYTHRSIPGLFGFGVFEATRRFLQVQGVVMPMLYTSLAVNMLHPLWNWLLITKFGWGFDGAPWATVLSQSLMAFLLLTYMFFRPVHVAGTWSGVCRDAVKDIGEYLRFGVPGGASCMCCLVSYKLPFTLSRFPVFLPALVLCLEWWLFEIVGFMAGSMGSVPLAVNNIAAGVVQLVFNVPFGVSVAGATMLGNLLGGGESSGAKRVTTVMLSLSTAFALIYAVAIAVCRGVLPKVRDRIATGPHKFIAYRNGGTLERCLQAIVSSFQPAIWSCPW